MSRTLLATSFSLVTLNTIYVGTWMAGQWLELGALTAVAPDWGTKIPQGTQCSQKRKKYHLCWLVQHSSLYTDLSLEPQTLTFPCLWDVSSLMSHTHFQLQLPNPTESSRFCPPDLSPISFVGILCLGQKDWESFPSPHIPHANHLQILFLKNPTTFLPNLHRSHHKCAVIISHVDSGVHLLTYLLLSVLAPPG